MHNYPGQGKDVFLGTADEAETAPGVWEWVPKPRLDAAEARIAELESLRAEPPTDQFTNEEVDKFPIDGLQALVNEQAEDELLWFIAETMPEAYLQQELRRLHAAIEKRVAPPTDGDLISRKAAIEALDKMRESEEWHPSFLLGVDEAIDTLQSLGAAEHTSAPKVSS
jgi:hypothetical protein